MRVDKYDEDSLDIICANCGHRLGSHAGNDSKCWGPHANDRPKCDCPEFIPNEEGKSEKA